MCACGKMRKRTRLVCTGHRAPTCSAIAYTWGLSSPSMAPRYCAIMRAPYRCFSGLCGFTCAACARVSACSTD